MGLAGATQVFRIDLKSEQLRRGRVVKTTTETSYRVTSLLPEEAGPQALMDEARGYWAIENGQHDRRAHTLRGAPPSGESYPGCPHPVHLPLPAAAPPSPRPTLPPGWLKGNHCNPNRLIRLLSDPGA